jgi:hypothetical protein
LGTATINQNLIQKEIKRLNSGNAFRHLIQNLLPSRLPSKYKTRVYQSIILPVALNGYEIWSLTLREEHRPRVFENRVLRSIFGPKRDQKTGGWRKLHNEELHNLYSSLKSRRMRWAAHVASMGAKRNVCRILVGKAEGKR